MDSREFLLDDTVEPQFLTTNGVPSSWGLKPEPVKPGQAAESRPGEPENVGAEQKQSRSLLDILLMRPRRGSKVDKGPEANEEVKEDATVPDLLLPAAREPELLEIQELTEPE